jgi:hypothetical protein
MKTFVLFVLSVWMVHSLKGQAFEGVIELSEKKGSSVQKLVYTVKGKMVRIDTYNSDGELKGAKIVDTESGIVLALMPSRKLYFQIMVRPIQESDGSVKRTGEQKEILSISASKAEIVNTKLDRKTTLYFGGKDFTFFLPLVRALGNEDSFSFGFIHSSTNERGEGIPLEITEFRNDGMELMNRRVTSITRKPVDEAVFDIPVDYSLMER